jgi:hypothetical protein
MDKAFPQKLIALFAGPLSMEEALAQHLDDLPQFSCVLLNNPACLL